MTRTRVFVPRETSAVSVGADDVALIVHHLLVLAKDLNGRADSGNEEIGPADALLPEALEFAVQVLAQFIADFVVKARGLAGYLAGDDVDG